jgi:hypothetical protein
LPNAPYDKERQKGYWQKYYDKNKEDVKRRAAAHAKATRKKYDEMVNAAKDQPCADCGIRYPHYVMDFDHVRGEKQFNIAARYSGRYTSLAALIEEIAKCDVVCANCHRTRTWTRRHTPL